MEGLPLRPRRLLWALLEADDLVALSAGSRALQDQRADAWRLLLERDFALEAGAAEAEREYRRLWGFAAVSEGLRFHLKTLAPPYLGEISPSVRHEFSLSITNVSSTPLAVNTACWTPLENLRVSFSTGQASISSESCMRVALKVREPAPFILPPGRTITDKLSLGFELPETAEARRFAGRDPFEFARRRFAPGMGLLCWGRLLVPLHHPTEFTFRVAFSGCEPDNLAPRPRWGTGAGDPYPLDMSAVRPWLGTFESPKFHASLGHPDNPLKGRCEVS